MARPISRAIAGMLGLFLILGALAALTAPRLDATIWVLDLRWLPGWAGVILQGLGGVVLMWYAAAPPCRGGVAGRILIAVLLPLVLLAGIDAARFYWLSMTDGLAGAGPIPFSAIVLVLLAIVLGRAVRRNHARVRGGWALAAIAAGVCLPAFPLAQMMTFGLSDYRRPADAILVFGARTYADGRVSDALGDRVRAAAELYQQGLAPVLILSGGPGDGDVHETEAMARMLAGLGVPEKAMVFDRTGLNTRASIASARTIAAERGLRSILAVSHFYHLPRVKMQGQRCGLELYTVPAAQGQPLVRLPIFMAREVAACWWYFLRPGYHCE